MIPRPDQPDERYRSRIAVIYLRRTVIAQDPGHAGGTTPPELPALLKELGWPEERIEVIEEDLGLLLDRMSTGTIGVVAVTDLSRLGRNPADLGRFAELAVQHDVLLYHSGQLVDFRGANSRYRVPAWAYVRQSSGIWGKVDDSRARELITLIVDKFAELGSVGAVSRWLNENGFTLQGRRLS